MQMLNPTLWRTCKMLAGKSRILLLRQIHAHPGQAVAELGRKVGLGHAAASQELRRIQSRGLLQAERRGSFVIYKLAADPQVPAAAPLLSAIQAAFALYPQGNDSEICRVSGGLAHERRIRIVRTLLDRPSAFMDLQILLRIPAHPCHEHIQTLMKSGYVVRKDGQFHLAAPDHPLAKALLKLIQQGTGR